VPDAMHMLPPDAIQLADPTPTLKLPAKLGDEPVAKQIVPEDSREELPLPRQTLPLLLDALDRISTEPLLASPKQPPPLRSHTEPEVEPIKVSPPQTLTAPPHAPSPPSQKRVPPCDIEVEHPALIDT
jgi:hypothetical protein